MEKGMFRKIRKGVGFVLIPTINFKSLVKNWKSFKATFSEAKNKYNEDKKLINEIDKNNNDKLKAYSKKDLNKIEVANRSTLIFLSLLICYMLLQINENILFTFFKLLPILIILSILSFSLSYLHFVFKNR